MTEPPTKEYTRTGLILPLPTLRTYIADVQLGLHTGQSTTGAGTVPESVAYLWIHR